MQGPASHLYFSQGLRLHYVDWGNEDAPPLLLVHGGRDHCRNWDWVAERLRNRYHIVAPDLRGHGDSEWQHGGYYTINNYVYDIAQLIHQKHMAPLTILAHSLGGVVTLTYAGVFPDTVLKIIDIEGLGPQPDVTRAMNEVPIPQRLRNWINTRRENSGRVPRKYPTLEAAIARMQEENPRLTDEQARHLTVHGANQNEDGSFSWKFDNLVRMDGGIGSISEAERTAIWGDVTAPILVARGTESWAGDPAADGRMNYFRNARLVNFEGAGHWVHHDKLDAFMSHVDAFLAE